VVWFVIFVVLRGGLREFGDDFFNWVQMGLAAVIVIAYFRAMYAAAFHAGGHKFAAFCMGMLLLTAPMVGMGFFTVPVWIRTEAM
jgi:hypothetical protein